jgi:hypothetical protein
MATITCALGLAFASALVWSRCLEIEASPIPMLLRLAALCLVVSWTHFLVWLTRKMFKQQISNGYCTVLFFGGWIVFFLIHNCLL